MPDRDEIAAIDDPRERLVAAATRVLLDDLDAIIAAGIRPDVVAAMAGRSRRSFYDHFDDRTDLLRAVAASLLDPDRSDHLTPSVSVGIPHALDVAEGDLLGATTAIAASSHAASLASDRTAARTLLWLIGRNDESVAALLRRHHDASDDHIGANLDRLAALIGLTFRSPWDGRRVGRVVRALNDGMYLRTRIGDDADPDLFALTCLSLLPMVTRSVGAPDVELTEYLGEFARELWAAWREDHEVEELIDARDRVMTALRTTIDDEGPAIDLAGVARTAGLSLRTVVAAFDTIDDLVVAAIVESLPPLADEAAFDKASGELAVRDMVQRHLLRVGQWSLDEPQLARVILASVNGGAPLPIERAGALFHLVSAPLVDIVHDLAGVAVRHVDATATMTTGALLGHSLVGHEHLDHTVDWLTDIVIGGLGLDRGGPGDPGDGSENDLRR